MNRLKRILALAGALLLACMYIATLVFALMDSPLASGLFRASVAATILVPVLLYGYILSPACWAAVMTTTIPQTARTTDGPAVNDQTQISSASFRA